MRKLLLLSAVFLLFLSNCKQSDNRPRVLVFSKTTGYRHASISNGKAAIQKLARENNFQVDTTEDASYFTEENLKKYAVIIFLNTTGDVLNSEQEIAMERFIQAGGGFVGIHSATDTEYDWIWYANLVGAQFADHPEIQPARLVVTEKIHPSTKSLPEAWTRTDEWYNFKRLNKDVRVLLKIDETSYKGGTLGADHPMAW